MFWSFCAPLSRIFFLLKLSCQFDVLALAFGQSSLCSLLLCAFYLHNNTFALTLSKCVNTLKFLSSPHAYKNRKKKMMFYGVSSVSSVSFVSSMRRTAENNNHGRRARTTAQKKNLRREVVSSCGGSSRLREERRRRSAHAKRREKKIEDFSSSPLWVAKAGSSANAESEFYAAQDARHKAFLVANELKKKKKVPKIVKRTVSALVLGVLAAFFLGFGGWFWVALIGLCAYASGTEYFELMSKVNEELPHPPPRWAAKWITACSVFLCVILHVSGGRSLPVTMAMVAAFSCAVAALISNEESHFIEFTTTLFGLFYCGFLPSFWIKLRAMSGIPLAIDRAGSIVSSWPLQLGGPTSWTLGVSITLMTVLCVVSADVGAYFSGKNFGKKFFGKKLTTISPNKTIEGAIGGGIFSIACSGICWYLLGIPEELWRTLIIGGFIYASSVFGDLLQSVMKRNAGVKDSGKFIPGHGGFLDRFDSYMFTGSVTYYLTLALIVGLNIRPKYFGA